MPPTTRRARANWAFSYVFALPELWAIVAEHSGVVGAWRLTGVCVAARVGAKEWLRTLPGLVVWCGWTEGEMTNHVWRLDLGELRWEHMPSLTCGRIAHACCAVRGSVVVLGGMVEAEDDESESDDEAGETVVASVEILGLLDSEAKVLPPLSYSRVTGSAAVAIQESESKQGRVFLIGGWNGHGSILAVHNIDLATGVCTPQPPLLSNRGNLAGCSAARLADGSIVCVGTNYDGALGGTAQVLEPPEQGASASGASWQWRYLPAMSVERCFGGGCVLSDGRFAALGGCDSNNVDLRSCEALIMDGAGERRVRHRRRW
jgi:hypothetical protein